MFDGLGEEALFEAIESVMSGISGVSMSPEGDGAIGRPELAGQDSNLQASDCLEQVSLSFKHGALRLIDSPSSVRRCSYCTISRSAMSIIARPF